jgi:glycosyltransferase involved in cell wall biosynthesis
MKSIRIGVIFDQRPGIGGGYHQALNSALMMLEIPKELAEPIFFTTNKADISVLKNHGIDVKEIKLSFIEKLKDKIRQKILNKYILKVLKKIQKYSSFEKKLLKHKVDLVYFLSPTYLPQKLEKLNYITTLWDLCHRDDPEFPEVRQNKEFERRDDNYKKILPKATAILVDSDLSKQNVLNRYGIDFERVHIIPFQPSRIILEKKKLNNNQKINIHKKFNVESYIFYPAQFWPHKNHIYLLNGLHLLDKNYGIKVAAIFSGNDTGNKKYVENFAFKLNLQNRIRFIGYVSDEEMLELYQQSIALVMPSYFGPTNLPPLEAFKLGVPVLYPNKKGLRDQVGDAALLMDLNDPFTMTEHLKNIIEKKDLREKLINRGYERLRYFDNYDRIGILKNIIQNFSFKRITWD